MKVLSRRFVLAGLTAGLVTKAGAKTTPLHLLCFGNSLMAGFGLAPEDRFPRQLTDWLRRHSAPEHIISTAALTGDTSYGGRMRIRPALRRKPDAVIIEIGANDMLLGMSARKAEKNLDVILAKAREGGRPVLLAGIGAIGRNEKFRTEWNAIWPRLAQRHGCYLIPDLYKVIRAANGYERKNLLQPDGLHASRLGTRTMVDLAGPVVYEMLRQVPES